MPYFLESPQPEQPGWMPEPAEITPEELTLADQACGSGHILLYAFELFTAIYEEAGYSPSEIPNLIFEENLTGFEIDPRAAQLASFTLLMRARRYRGSNRFFRRAPQTPHRLPARPDAQRRRDRTSPRYPGPDD